MTVSAQNGLLNDIWTSLAPILIEAGIITLSGAGNSETCRRTGLLPVVCFEFPAGAFVVTGGAHQNTPLLPGDVGQRPNEDWCHCLEMIH